MITYFKEQIRGAEAVSWERHNLCLAIVYTVIMFCASIHVSDGLKLGLKNW